jgi:hypothetical protein
MQFRKTYLALVSFVGVTPAAQVSSEQWLRHVFLRDHVVHGRLLLVGRNSVDRAECQTKQTATIALKTLSAYYDRDLVEIDLPAQTAAKAALQVRQPGSRP